MGAVQVRSAFNTSLKGLSVISLYLDVVVYHVNIVAIGHGLLKKFWPLVIGCVLRTALLLYSNLKHVT